MRQFVADAGHELRTPLTSVRGFAELYRIGAVDQGPALDDAMSRIEAEAARMGVLVDDLLLLARLDQQRPLEITDVDVVDLVTDAVTAARAAAPDRELAVHVSDPAVGLSRPRGPPAPAPGRGQPAVERPAVLTGRTSRWRSGSESSRRSGGSRDGRRSRSSTTARGCPPRWRRGRSSGSTARTPPAPAPRAAPGWACRSSRRSSPRTAGRVDLDTGVGQGCQFTVCLPLETGIARVDPVAGLDLRACRHRRPGRPDCALAGRDRRAPAGYSRPASCTRRRKSRVRWSWGSCSSDCGRAALDDGPRRQEAHLVGHLLGEPHLVGGDDHGHPLGLELAHGGQHLVDQHRVQGGGHLVHEHQPRRHRQRAHDRHPLLLAPGQPVGVLLGLVREAEALQERQALGLGRRPWPPCAPCAGRA